MESINYLLNLAFLFRDKTVMIFNPGMGDKLQLSNTDNMLNSYIKQEETQGNYFYIIVNTLLYI
jgi:hypothetical protein